VKRASTTGGGSFHSHLESGERVVPEQKQESVILSAIGEENAYLLGALDLSKLQQLALSRCKPFEISLADLRRGKP
jgi:hypothetical protein